MAPLNTIQADLTAPPVGDPSQTDRLLGLMKGQARYVCEEWLPPRIGAGIPESTGPPDDYFGDGAVGAARDLASAAVALAVGVGTDRLGVASEAARTQAIRAIDLVAARHKISAGATGWGRSWQGPLVSGQVGLAAWLLWDDLSTTTQRGTEALIVDEANLLATEGVYYYRDVDGTVIRPGLDTGAEEESWRARGLSIAVAMFASHHQRVRWERNLLTRQLASYSRPADVGSDAAVHLAPRCAWLAGSNMEPNGDLSNHEVNPHPNYMRPPNTFAAMVQQAIAGQPISYVTAYHGLDALFSALRRLTDDDGTHAYPPEFAALPVPEYPSPQATFYANAVQHRVYGSVHADDAADLEERHGANAVAAQDPQRGVIRHVPVGSDHEAEEYPVGPAVAGDVAAKLAEAYLMAVVWNPRSVPRRANGRVVGPSTGQGAPTACSGLGEPFADLSGEPQAAARWADAREVMPGYPDGTFRPGAGVDRITAVAVLHRVAGAPTVYPYHPFDDVAHDDGEADRALRWAWGEGIALGSGRATFSPHQQITRGQIAVMMWRERGKPEAPDAGYTDVSGDEAKAADYLEAAALTNAVGRFNPNQLVNRGDLAVLVWRLWGR